MAVSHASPVSIRHSPALTEPFLAVASSIGAIRSNSAPLAGRRAPKTARRRTTREATVILEAAFARTAYVTVRLSWESSLTIRA